MKPAKDCLIFPLDVPTRQEAAKWVALLSPHVGIFKLGLELFIRCGPDIVKVIKGLGGEKIFLDLKLHDIPATVFRAVAAIVELGVDFATVHCGESVDMLNAAVDAGAGRVRLLGVTLLTSISRQEVQQAGYADEFVSDPERLVLKKAAMAKTAGLAGVVCSGREVRTLKEIFGKDFLAVTPGIRPSDETVCRDDQKRVVTPAMAIHNGADFLVVGRPIRDADDPARMASRIVEEIAACLGR
jgi:orotidine-5'-phosphate decarboxylase